MLHHYLNHTAANNHQTNTAPSTVSYHQQLGAPAAPPLPERSPSDQSTEAQHPHNNRVYRATFALTQPPRPDHVRARLRARMIIATHSI
jgi:hypothetical protein